MLLFLLCSEKSFVTILTELAAVIVREGLKNIVNAERGNVLDGGLRAFKRGNFNPQKLLSVRFTGEDGIDSGGLSREFLRLCLSAIRKMGIFCGSDNCKNINLDYKGYCQTFNTVLHTFSTLLSYLIIG